MTTSEFMPSLTQSYADKFAANWKAQNPEEEEDSNGSLDDSLTNLQWLHHINIQDITASNSSTLSKASGSAEGSNFSDSECQSDSGESKNSDQVLKEPLIDYKNDPHHKPPFSYATLICMAMRETKKVKITLSSIYKWIKENFMYYRMADPTWQNSIRHNLSLNKCFVKVARRKDEPGKGGFWKIDPEYADMFVDGVFKRRRGVNTQKNAKKNLKKSSKKSIEAERKRLAKRQSDEPKSKRQKINSLRVSDPSEIFDEYSEEEIPPFSGGLKGKFSWNSVLTTNELDESIRELADAHGITLDGPSHTTTGGYNSNTLNPSPSIDNQEVPFKVDPDLDLTIQGIAIHPSRDHLTTPSPTALTDATQSLFKYMPPSPPRLYDDDHPWTDTCFDFTDENNNILDNVCAFSRQKEPEVEDPNHHSTEIIERDLGQI